MRMSHWGLLAVAATVVGMTSLAQATVDTFQASTGFSGTQGLNGWSYAGVGYAGASDLATNAEMATYYSGPAEWNAGFAGTAGVNLTASQQDKIEGNAVFSLRIWTAPRNYSSVNISSTLVSTNPEGAWLGYYNASTTIQTEITPPGTQFSTNTTGTQDVTIDASLTNVNAGDRIYFVLQNSGATGGLNNVLNTWDPTITANYSVPEPAALAVLVLGGAGLLLLKRRRMA